MNLKQIMERLAQIDQEVRDATDVAAVEKLTQEKTSLLARKAELETLEARKAEALKVAGGSGTTTARRTADTDPEDKLDSLAYRKAFMRYVTRRIPIPAELRAGDETTLTTDVATAIPTVIANRIIEKIESIGMILPMVTRTNYAAGVAIPTSTVKPTATWVGEGEGSDRQKKTTSSITFGKFKLRCEIGYSAEVGAMALSAFEDTFVRNVSEAMVKAIEGKIISTDAGAANPRGILAETPESGQALTASALEYETLTSAEAALPQAYDSGAVWCMTKKTFMAFAAMTDAEGQPIARTNYGLGSAPERFLLGRPVVLCGDYMDSFSSTLTAGKIFAFLFDFREYVLNTVYDMGIMRRQDWDTEENQVKAVMSCDGKVVDKHSLVTLAKA